MTASSQDITQLLQAWSDGDHAALELLAPQVEAELRRLARHYLRNERPDHTLQTTALVNEAYLKLIGWKNVRWQDRAHFLGVSAGLMRRVLVDYARRNRYLKRGGGGVMVSLEEIDPVPAANGKDFLAIDNALTRLTDLDPRKGQIVELRFFGGLEMKEISEVLKISERTVKREWRMAQAWLYCQLTGRENDDA
jgi:RNA polymerase sigma-70 factor, ECF subfamily